MTRIEHELEPYRAGLARDPTDLNLAAEYWRALGDCRGDNIRNGSHPVEAFRAAALASAAGVVALCAAGRELYNESGEAPRSRYFDHELMSALRRSLPELAPPDAAAVEWVHSCLEEGSF